MARSNRAHAFAPDQVLAFSRVFDAPPGLLFRLWADPAHRVRWWGPSGKGLVRCEVDFRVGGAWSVIMKGDAGDEHPVRGIFTEIIEPRRLCFTYINAHDEHEMLVEMDFAPVGSGTRIDFFQAPFISVAERDAHRFGWTSTLELLAQYAVKVRRAGAIKPVGEPRRPGDD